MSAAPANGRPDISVVLATYDRRATLPRAIASVFAQEDAHFELIVVDDASRDGTPQYLASLKDPRIRVIVAERIAGVKGVHPLDVSKIPTLKPAFKKDGTVTAASSASISDGAAAVVLTRESIAARKGLKPLARIVGYTSFAREPEWFTLAPVGAIRKLLTRLNLRASDVDLYEVNEAFAVVAMAAIRDLDLDHARVNVNGGACALGHPIGATGVRILTTLIHALKSRGQRRGIASLCIGGGEATALAIEMI